MVIAGVVCKARNSHFAFQRGRSAMRDGRAKKNSKKPNKKRQERSRVPCKSPFVDCEWLAWHPKKRAAYAETAAVLASTAVTGKHGGTKQARR